MTESIDVRNNFICFPAGTKYGIGQQVKTGEELGYVIGIKLGRFGWDYLVVMGDPPDSDSEEKWVYQHQITHGW